MAQGSGWREWGQGRSCRVSRGLSFLDTRAPASLVVCRDSRCQVATSTVKKSVAARTSQYILRNYDQLMPALRRFGAGSR